ncbi:MAG: TIM barrel protein, partial [Planctomycetota bacterium]
MKRSTHGVRGVPRRGFLSGAMAVGALGAAGAQAQTPASVASQDYRIQRGRIKFSVFDWCFASMPMDRFIRACHAMGVPAMDVDQEYYPLLRQLGMKVAMTRSHVFTVGPVCRENHPMCIEQLRSGIDLAVRWNCSHVIAFTGNRKKGVSDEQGARNCVDCWKQVVGHAERKGVNVCLEMLNSRDDSHLMKGVPGYFGDDVERCIDLIRRVDSPRMKLLFDVYHVQIMSGDVIRRIRQYKEYIAHYHVAGVPGRGEPDETQEINYPGVMRAILDTGYTGYVSMEFMPTWPDKLAARRSAIRL